MSDRLDSRSLRQFLAVAETLSFRQAAETLHMSQPPLSRAIRQMEARLGTALFERDTQGVALTPAGRRLLPFARRILRLMAQAQAAVAERQLPARLRIGLTSAVEPEWFPNLVQALERHGIAADLSNGPSPRLVRMLSAGRLDAAFIALPTSAPGLETDVLGREPLMATLAVTHRLARRRTVSLADLQQDPLFWFPRSRQPAFFDHCKAVFQRHGYSPSLQEEPEDHHRLLAAVSTGRGVALLPASFASLRRPGVCYKPLREGDELYVGIGLATPGDRSDLRAFLKRLVREAPLRR